jgi:MerR family transcriptional regulator, copper efflux regulator
MVGAARARSCGGEEAGTDQELPWSGLRTGLTLKSGSMFTLGGMNGLRVAELAARAGVAPSTVRFYERAGLLSPARRAANGYRVFDESAVEELALIQRAKGIGMSLEYIAELVAVWPSGSCQSLQARMRVHLAGRISAVRLQRAELETFERQLQTVLDRLSARDPGPEQCGRGCGCETDLELGPDRIAPGPKPWGCSLDPDALASRIGQWHEVVAAAVSVEDTGGSVRLALPADTDMIASVARLCLAETACCPQARFLLEVTASHIVLTVEAPPGDKVLAMLLADDALARR